MRRYLIFTTVSLVLLLGGVGGTSVAVALEVMRTSFDVSVVSVGWVISIYQLGLTTSMPVVGKISDVLGRKPTFMLCVVLFVLGSLGSALAPSISLVIVSRFVQALGGGGFLPSAVGIVADEFPESRQRAVGLFSSIFPIGQIAGPVVGGWLIETFGWRAVFWLNVPAGLLVLIPAGLLLRSGGRREGGIDLVGAGLVSGSLAALMGALSLLISAETLHMRVVVGALFCATVVLALLFLRHEARTKDPIVDLEILRGRPFVAANIYNLVFGAGIVGVMSLIPMFAVSVYGVSYLESGLILVPRAIGMFVTSFIVSLFMMRLGYRWPIVSGTALAAVSLMLLSVESHRLSVFGLDSSIVLALIVLVMGMGVGLAAPASNNACLELMPHRAATITGIRGMFRQAGGAISITLATLVLHQTGDMELGFRIVFIGLAVTMLAVLPVVFAMPKSPVSR